MRAAAALPLLLSFGISCQGLHRHELTKAEEPIMTLDHTVLGNLRNDAQLANLQVPKRHLFVASLTVGTPGQQMTCLLDSGTADLWLPSKRCSSCAAEHRFRAEQSKTFMPAVIHTPDGLMPVPVQIPYGNGEIVGFLVQDRVSLAQREFANQSFIIVEEEDLPKRRTWDGVCGLGWKQLTDAGYPMYRNMRGGYPPVFALLPGRSAGQAATYLTVGEFPLEDVYADTLGWAPAESLEPNGKRSFWVASGGVSINSGSPIKARVLVDTATAFMLVPPRHFKTLMRSLFNEQVFDQYCGLDAKAGNLVVCDCAATMDANRLGSARFSVHLGGKEFAIPAKKLFKRVLSTPPGRGFLCLLLVQQSPVADLVLDPMALLATILESAKEEAERQQHGGPPGGPPPPGVPPPPHTGSIDAGALLAPFLFPDLLPAKLGGKAGPPPPPGPGPVPQSGRRLQTLGGGGLFMPDPMQDVWVLGGVFLDHFATILDFENRRLGFAVAREGPHPTAMGTVAPYSDAAAAASALAAAAAAPSSDAAAAAAAAWPPGPQAPSNPAAAPPPQASPAQGGYLLQAVTPQQDQAQGQVQQVTSSGGHFPWGGLFVTAGMIAGAAGVGHLYRKTKSRKNQSTDHADEDPNDAELLAE